VTALVGASVAFAHGNPGKGKPVTRPGKPAKPTGPNCRPSVMVVLKGTLASDPAAGDTKFELNVLKANRHGRAYVSAGQPITLDVDASTKVRRKASGSAPTKTLESLAFGRPRARRGEGLQGRSPRRRYARPDCAPREGRARPGLGLGAK
jgi:hypothetical protein